MKARIPKSKPESVEEFDFAPDKNRLDDGWVDQVRMITYYGDLLRKARLESDLAKRELDLYEAELATKVRKSPEKYGLDKVTEVALKEIVTKKVLSSDLYQRVIDAKDRVNHFQVATTALEHRKKALEDLVYLHSIQYFGEPRTPKGVKQSVIDDMEEERIIRKASTPKKGRK